MITKIFKITAVVLMLAGFFPSCTKRSSVEDDEVCLCSSNIEHISCSSIIGKWKLEFISGTQETTYYSQCNVLYEFNVDHILTVSGKGDIADNRIHDNGVYHFKLAILEDVDLFINLNPRRSSIFLQIDSVRYGSVNGTMADGTPGLHISLREWDNIGLPANSYTMCFSKIN